jgi:hypothetical protein
MATYQATDGGELDTNTTLNGVIVTPVGLAQNVVGAPNTGLGGRPYCLQFLKEQKSPGSWHSHNASYGWRIPGSPFT